MLSAVYAPVKSISLFKNVNNEMYWFLIGLMCFLIISWMNGMETVCFDLLSILGFSIITLSAILILSFMVITSQCILHIDSGCSEKLWEDCSDQHKSISWERTIIENILAFDVNLQGRSSIVVQNQKIWEIVIYWDGNRSILCTAVWYPTEFSSCIDLDNLSIIPFSSNRIPSWSTFCLPQS